MVDRVMMVSPPVDFLEFTGDVPIQGLGLVIMGDEDMFDASGRIKKYATSWNKNTHVEIIHGADHFYSGCADQLKNTLIPFFTA